MAELVATKECDLDLTNVVHWNDCIDRFQNAALRVLTIAICLGLHPSVAMEGYDE